MELAGPPPDTTTLPRLGTGFSATAAVRCQLEPRRRADGGQDSILT